METKRAKGIVGAVLPGKKRATCRGGGTKLARWGGTLFGQKKVEKKKDRTETPSVPAKKRGSRPRTGEFVTKRKR